MIMLNIVISFVLEMYSIVSEEVESTYRKRTLANQLVDVFETEEQLEQFVQAYVAEQKKKEEEARRRALNNTAGTHNT